MSFIDVFIPLFAGIYLLVSGDKLLKTTDASSVRKKGLAKKIGIALIGVSLVYLTVKLLEQ
jgi:hypothetical protein